MKLKCLFC